jgi:hypothetical protein
VHIHTCLLRVTDTMTSQNIDLPPGTFCISELRLLNLSVVLHFKFVACIYRDIENEFNHTPRKKGVLLLVHDEYMWFMFRD